MSKLWKWGFSSFTGHHALHKYVICGPSRQPQSMGGDIHACNVMISRGILLRQESPVCDLCCERIKDVWTHHMTSYNTLELCTPHQPYLVQSKSHVNVMHMQTSNIEKSHYCKSAWKTLTNATNFFTHVHHSHPSFCRAPIASSAHSCHWRFGWYIWISHWLIESVKLFQVQEKSADLQIVQKVVGFQQQLLIGWGWLMLRSHCLTAVVPSNHVWVQMLPKRQISCYPRDHFESQRARSVAPSRTKDPSETEKFRWWSHMVCIHINQKYIVQICWINT